jgi:hypothetical protein
MRKKMDKPKLIFNVEHNSNEVIWIHYVLAVINVFLPWSIVSWIGIPLSLYAKDRLALLEYKNVNFNLSHKLYTTIALGVFILYFSLSVIRFLFL